MSRRGERAREELWARLPAVLRRRPPRTRVEKCVVLDLIDTARQGGLSLREAARTCGVSVVILETWREERREILALVDELEKSCGPLLRSD